MHTEKIKIFDDYAKNIDPKPIQMGAGDLEIKDWEDLLLAFRYSKISLPDVKRIIFQACDLVQKAQQDRIAKAANVKHTIIVLGEKFPETTKSYGNDEEIFTVDQESITSENNLIK